MLAFSANIEMLAPPVDFLDRIAVAKESGFDAIEFWSWEGKDLASIKERCSAHGLAVSALSGDGKEWALCDGDHRKGYIDYARASFEAAAKVGCTTVVIHSNALDDGPVVDDYHGRDERLLYMDMHRTLVELAPYAEKAKITCVLEPLNRHVDHSGYLLHTIKDAAMVVRSVASERIKVLFDMYHMQIEQGNLISTYDRYRDAIGYIHIADSPGRGEPGTGEINYQNVFSHLRDAGHSGYIGFELAPRTTYEAAVQAIMALPR